MKGTHNYTLIQGQKNQIGMDNQEITPSEIWEVLTLVMMT
jgi:hypothetical protein